MISTGNCYCLTGSGKGVYLAMYQDPGLPLVFPITAAYPNVPACAHSASTVLAN